MNENQNQFDPQDVQNTKGLCALSYIGILFLVPMIANKDSAYTKFHVNQGLVLFICEIIIGFLAIIPIVGWILSPILYLVSLIFAILGIVNAVQGVAKPLPIIGNIQLYK